MRKISINKMTKDNISDAAELEKLCFSCPWSSDSFESALENKNSYFICAEINFKFAGYAGMYSAADEGYIYNIAVHEEFRNMGVGEALIRNLLEYSEKKCLGFLSLEVRASNAAAIHLYEKCKFIKNGIRKNFYDSPQEDAVIMTCYSR
jgi:ribosomal-protein-alanine N-acetyltransferase